MYSYSYSQKKHRADGEVCQGRIRSESPERILNFVCDCGKVYIGQSGRSIETRCKERQRHVRLDQHGMSVVANDSINTFHTPSSVATGYMDRLVKEAIEVGPKITLTETVAWYPVTSVLRRTIVQNEHLIPPTISPWIATNHDSRVPADI